MSEVVKLLGAWPSPFVIRARIALNIKSVEYEFIEETFGKRSELLLKSNPVNKQIPVLIHGDKSIPESMLIVQYIDEAWSSAGPPILPSLPFDRAIARFWPTYIDDKWFPALKSIVLGLDTEPTEEKLKKVREGLALLEDAFNKISKGKDFFGGDQIGYIDIGFGSFLAWLKLVEETEGVNLVDETTTPSLAKWVPKFCEHDAVKDVLPPIEKLIGFSKLLRSNVDLVINPK
ncbi:glutathione s-transferase [Stylosanthes scabra]|uniref:Glutathione S-transferase n=1 Tax=Stylosanthes scabra TaxID=79078 RepID=A0ABU6QFK6_9FABA|nr:glutathione s-transferase [Stylosanthes scabra]